MVNRRTAFAWVSTLAVVLAVLWQPAAAQEPQPIVHAVLFYSPTCGHCEYVINEVLPPLYEKYGDQLQILGFDVTTPRGQEMFASALQHFQAEQRAVPYLVIDDITLVGSQEIPEQFPQLVGGYLALGGVDWPAIPGLREMLIAAAMAATAQAPTSVGEAPTIPLSEITRPKLSWQDRFEADATANTIAVIVLAGMIAAVAFSMVLFRTRGDFLRASKHTWVIPTICLLGLVVAGYLAYVEATGHEAVCGPIGDCNTVQQSPYARLFGVLSIGALGIIGYLAIGAAWLLSRFSGGRSARLARIALFALALLGTLFSIYLTFLEPFVIGATCAWCLTSAALVTALMLLSAGAAGKALQRANASAQSPARGPRRRPAGRRR